MTCGGVDGAYDADVLESLRQQEILSRNPEEELQAGSTAGQRVADRVAAFGGSWRFIMLFPELDAWFLAVIPLHSSCQRRHFSLVMCFRIQSARSSSETCPLASASISVTTSASVALNS